jgi:hypothetical protein
LAEYVNSINSDDDQNDFVCILIPKICNEVT